MDPRYKKCDTFSIAKKYARSNKRSAPEGRERRYAISKNMDVISRRMIVLGWIKKFVRWLRFLLANLGAKSELQRR